MEDHLHFFSFLVEIQLLQRNKTDWQTFIFSRLLLQERGREREERKKERERERQRERKKERGRETEKERKKERER